MSGGLRVAAGIKLGREEVVRGREIQFFLDRPEADDRDLDATRGEAIGAKSRKAIPYFLQAFRAQRPLKRRLQHLRCMWATVWAEKAVQNFMSKSKGLNQLLAEREGFEPSRRYPAYTRSRRAPSTTRPPLQSRP